MNVSDLLVAAEVVRSVESWAGCVSGALQKDEYQRLLEVAGFEDVSVEVTHISAHESRTLERYLEVPFDHVVTVCDDANEASPFFSGASERLHWSFRDPSKAAGGIDERLQAFRNVRDEIRVRIENELIAGV